MTNQLLVTCKTKTAALLCAVPDAKGVLRIPGGALTPPGLPVAVAPLLPINPQLVAAASAFLRVDVALQLAVVQEFADELTLGDGDAATLYVATLSPGAGIVADPAWPSMPDILRRLSGRARIPYLRAWQVLAGGLHLETKAVEASEVAKHFDD